jgi:hypothetical protein
MVPVFHLFDFVVESPEEVLAVEGVVFDLVVVLHGLFVFVEEEVVLFGLAPVYYVLFELCFVHLQLGIFKPVVFIPVFVGF